MAATKCLPVYHYSAIVQIIYSRSLGLLDSVCVILKMYRILLKPGLKEMARVAHFISGDEQAQLSLVVRNRPSGFPTRSDTNQAVRPHKMARCLNFCI